MYKQHVNKVNHLFIREIFGKVSQFGASRFHKATLAESVSSYCPDLSPNASHCIS